MIKNAWKYIRLIALPLLMAVALVAMGSALTQVDSGRASEDKERLESAIRRAAVACYAVEGAYPPSLDYITENYRVQIDTERYTVRYELFASNLMPDVTVLDNEK